jgi:hypothetical protein
LVNLSSLILAQSDHVERVYCTVYAFFKKYFIPNSQYLIARIKKTKFNLQIGKSRKNREEEEKER